MSWVKLIACVGLGIASVASSSIYRPTPEVNTIPVRPNLFKEKQKETEVVVSIQPKPCTEVASTKASEPILLYQTLLWFEKGKPFLQAHAPHINKMLAQLPEIVSKYPDSFILLDGHADQLGSMEKNQKLSKERAKIVKMLLIAKLGIDLDRIRINAYGSSQPLDDDHDCSAYARNRRVEVRVMSGEN